MNDPRPSRPTDVFFASPEKSRLNIAVSMCGLSPEILQSITRQQPRLDALVVPEIGPNFLPPERAEDYYRIMAGRTRRWREKKHLLNELMAARERIESFVDFQKSHNKDPPVHLVFDNSDIEQEWYPSRVIQIRSRHPRNGHGLQIDPKNIAVVVGRNREEHLFRIAQSLANVRGAEPPCMLISDFLVGTADQDYENVPENNVPEMAKAERDLNFAKTVKNARTETQLRQGIAQNQRFIRDKFLGKIRMYVDPAYSSRGREASNIEKGNFPIDDGIAPSAHAGPIIMVEQTSTPNVKKTVHYASYVVLSMDEHHHWHSRKCKLERIKLQEGQPWVDNELERALIHVRYLEGEKYRAERLARKRGRRNIFFFGAALLGTATIAALLLTDAERLSPVQIDVLDDLGLEEHARPTEEGKYNEAREFFQEEKKRYIERMQGLYSRIDKLTKNVETARTQIDENKEDFEKRLLKRNEAITEYTTVTIPGLKKELADLEKEKETWKTAHQELNDSLTKSLDEMIEKLKDAEKGLLTLTALDAPVEALSPYLKSGVSTSYVDRFFGKAFAEPISTAYGNEYNIFLVAHEKQSYLKIVCSNGRVEIRSLKPKITEFFHTNIKKVHEHLSSIDQTLDKHMEEHGFIRITYTGKSIYGDIYRTLYKKDPTRADIEDIRNVVRGKMSVEKLDLLSGIKPGTRIKLKPKK